MDIRERIENELVTIKAYIESTSNNIMSNPEKEYFDNITEVEKVERIRYKIQRYQKLDMYYMQKWNLEKILEE